MSDEYLKGNYDYWQSGYYAPNVESHIFRMWGHVLQYEFSNYKHSMLKTLDFGCGQGSTSLFFKGLGWDVYGVDISIPDIDICKKRMNDIADNFLVVDPIPNQNDSWFGGGGYDLITASQSLYYYSDEDLQTRLLSLHRQMKPGGIIYATMIGTKNHFYQHSKPYKDGLRSVVLRNKRLNIDNYYVNFIDSKDELIKKFSIFEKMHIGYYDQCFSENENEGSSYHWTFVGKK